ncbi:MAG: MarR family winged helix-turn-helix transcriptional regulator [Hydrogeniiclostridium mannosilyticum]
MMNQFEFHLNDLLTRVYRSVELMEEQMLRSSKNLNLSINEIHLLEAVGGGTNEESGRSISELSSRMGIRLPSVTAAVNKLAAKGYVERERRKATGASSTFI